MNRRISRKLYLTGVIMDKMEVTLPELALVSGTRAMFGAGAALLLADKLNDDQRKAAGWTLLLVGAISTIPLVLEIFRRK
jgi:H+/gluconate symporter-like permease